MALVDKLKAGLKASAEQAAAKVEEGMERLQTKRELAMTYDDLGRKTFDLVDRGELTHAELQPLVETVRRLRAELEADRAEAAAAARGESETSEPPAAQ